VTYFKAATRDFLVGLRKIHEKPHLRWGFTNPGRLNSIGERLILVYPPVWNLLHEDALAPRILRWPLDFSKMCSPASATSSGSIFDPGTLRVQKQGNESYLWTQFLYFRARWANTIRMRSGVRPSVCLHFTAQLCNQLKFLYLLINQASNKTPHENPFIKAWMSKGFSETGKLHSFQHTHSLSLSHTHTHTHNIIGPVQYEFTSLRNPYLQLWFRTRGV
jgi:hypothetical protein